MPEEKELDPSIATIAVLQRETSLLKQIVEANIKRLDEALDRLETIADERKEFDPRISVVENSIVLLKEFAVERANQQEKAFKTALEASDKNIASTMKIAERAVAKVELSVSKDYVEAQINSLKETFSAQIKSQKEMTDLSAASADRAVTKAETATEKRFEAINGFRAQLENMAKTFAVKSEVDLRANALEDKLNTAVVTLSENKGKGAGINIAWVTAISAIGVIATVIGAIAVLTSNA